MTDNKSLQELVNHVTTLDSKIQSIRLCSLPMFNDAKESEFHAQFEHLIKKYSEFAEEYKVELGKFHQALLSQIKLNQLRELRRQNELERLRIDQQIEDVISNNTDPEIMDNLPEIDISSATSVNEDAKSKSNSALPPTPPLPVKTIKKAPKSPVAVVNKTPKKKSIVKKPPMQTTVKKVVKPMVKTPKRQPTPVKAMRNIANSHKIEEEEEVYNSYNMNYHYDERKVNWRFEGPQRSSTVVFIGNLPSKNSGIDITEKKIKYFVQLRAHVKLSQIEHIVLNNGSRGMYALVRFSGDVSLKKIEAFMNKINYENEKLFNENKEKKNKDKRNTGIVSWKKRVFLRFNRNIIKSGEAMWNDPQRNNTLFIQNFDILDEDCHYELTHLLLQYGHLREDIKIRVDTYGDPYCIVTFTNIDDAVYCCNQNIEFNGRILQSRYSKF